MQSELLAQYHWISTTGLPTDIGLASALHLGKTRTFGTNRPLFKQIVQSNTVQTNVIQKTVRRLNTTWHQNKKA